MKRRSESALVISYWNCFRLFELFCKIHKNSSRVYNVDMRILITFWMLVLGIGASG